VSIVSKGRRAFTLVELLVVMAVIAILIAILLPALTRARGQARKVKCMSNMRTIGQALSTYAADNKASMPFGLQFIGYTNGADEGTLDYYDWISMVDYYLAGKSRPAGYAQGSRIFDRDGVRYEVVSEAFLCPEVSRDVYNMDSNYGVHPVVFPNWWLETANTEPQPFDPPFDVKGRGKGAPCAPAKLNHLYNDNIIMWDTHAYASETRSPTVFSSYSCIDNGNLVKYSDPLLRFRSRGRDVYATNPLKAQNAIIFVPRPEDPSNQDDWQFNNDAAGEFIDNSQFGNIRFRHGKQNECNILMADFSVKTLNFDPKKLHPLTSLRQDSYYVDIRRSQLRIKRTYNLN
jgi:prepilin-type N-terminal cleavage/methylation domain-containing protein/prepilin-type processing-associated H-X9-DG protein